MSSFCRHLMVIICFLSLLSCHARLILPTSDPATSVSSSISIAWVSALTGLAARGTATVLTFKISNDGATPIEGITARLPCANFTF